MTSTLRPHRPPIYWFYLYWTAWLGFIVVALSSYQVLSKGIDYRWAVLTALTIIVGSCTLKIPGVNSKISLGDTFVLMSLIIFGPAAGCIAAALEAFSGSIRCKTRTRRLEFIMFNTGNIATCAYISGLMYSFVQGRGPLHHDPGALFAGSLPAALVLALSYYLLNSGTVAIMVALESRKSVYRIWKENFLWQSVNYLACAFGAVLLSNNGDPVTPLVLAPAGLVVTIIYASYRTVLGKMAANARS